MAYDDHKKFLHGGTSSIDAMDDHPALQIRMRIDVHPNILTEHLQTDKADAVILAFDFNDVRDIALLS